MTEPQLIEEPSAARDRSRLTRFALVDPALLGVALFRPLPKQHRSAARRQMVEVDTLFDGRKLRVVSPYTLGADDLSVMLAACGMAGLLGKALSASRSEAHRIAIVDGLESEGEVVEATHVRVRTSLYALVREAGLTNAGDAYRRVTESLMRLRGVYYADLGGEGDNARRLRAGGKQNLLGTDVDEGTGEIRIVLNARFAAAILGGHHIRIDLDETRQLSEQGRILHARLSVAIRVGAHLRVPVDRLAEWIYGGPPRSNQQTRDRRRYIREALAEIGGLADWAVAEEPRRKLVEVGRSGRDGRPGPHQGTLPLDM
ncbi:MAG: replication protein C, IncQ-type [Acetobacteraceae bacterium]|nr:replication protein C, IncQ-type [Acetobacteraceae bacterium]